MTRLLLTFVICFILESGLLKENRFLLVQMRYSFLQPVFDALYEKVRTLCASEDISVVEKCNVTEAMLLLR